MKKKIILFFLILTLVNNCGYQPIFSSKGTNFYINDIEFENKNKINKKIEKNFASILNKRNIKRFFDLSITSSKEIIIISKNSEGDANIFNMEIIINLKAFENSELKLSKNYKANFNYNNTRNKFSLKQYEKSIEENLIKKIIEQIKLNLETV